MPLDRSGQDYADLARELEVDFILIVIQNHGSDESIALNL